MLRLVERHLQAGRHRLQREAQRERARWPASCAGAPPPRASASSRGTTRLTRPIRSASCASTISPVSSISRARPLAHQARQALRARVAAHDAELDLGRAQLRVLGRHPQVAGQGQLAAAAQREPVHGRDHRLAQALDAVEHALSARASAPCRRRGSAWRARRCRRRPRRPSRPRRSGSRRAPPGRRPGPRRRASSSVDRARRSARSACRDG